MQFKIGIIILLFHVVFSAYATWPSAVRADPPPTCLNISGKWRGYLKLYNFGEQIVGAQIQQDGCYITINTSSHLPHGQVFVGLLNDWNFILAYDQRTGEDWTTFYERATRDRIRLYDFVNNYTGFDELILDRVVMKGDIDNSSEVDLVDAILTLQIITGKKPSIELYLQSDVNGDFKIGISEALYIVRYISENH